MNLIVVVAVSALSVVASAADNVKLGKKQATSFDTNSAFQVLCTALPASLVSQAITNPNAVSSEIASEFAAGSTPSWYRSLPTDVQSYLLSQGNSATATSATSGATNVPPAPSYAASTGPASTGMMPYGTNGTGPYATGSGVGTVGTIRPTVTTTTTPGSSTTSSAGTTSSSGSSSSSPSSGGAGGGSSSSSSASSGGAGPAPTAAFGAGIGLIAGLVGVIAL